MIKFFVTGDNHIGKKYDRYPNVKNSLIESRFESMDEMIKLAEKEKCDFFVVTGDMFDSVDVTKKDVERVVGILANFCGTVMVLPGNHDYYTGEEKVWKYFNDALSNVDNNIVLLSEFEKYEFETGVEKINIYPAMCQVKHSEDNNLKWIKDSHINTAEYNIGIAHGAVSGHTPDIQKQYFFMEKSELEKIPVDAWFIGHTHVSFPDIPVDKEMIGHKIFNPGVHEQTDLATNTKGYAFIVSLDCAGGEKIVSSRRVKVGNKFFYDLKVEVKNGCPLKTAIEEVISKKVDEPHSDSIVRIKASGFITKEDYTMRNQIYNDIFDDFLSYEYRDDELALMITEDDIKNEFPEIGFASRFLQELLSEPEEVQMAYELLKKVGRSDGKYEN